MTGIPAEHQGVFLVRWFLGMTFSAVNIAYYFIGVASSHSRTPRRTGRKVIDLIYTTRRNSTGSRDSTSTIAPVTGWANDIRQACNPNRPAGSRFAP